MRELASMRKDWIHVYWHTKSRKICYDFAMFNRTQGERHWQYGRHDCLSMLFT